MIYSLGPRAYRVYQSLRDRIVSGELSPGDKLPPHTQLATTFGVAPMTVRQVLAHLEREGLVSREQGRGTFVRLRVTPSVLIVDDEPAARTLLRAHVAAAGYNVLEASSAEEAIAILQNESSVALVLSDLRMPSKEQGVQFVKTARRIWPHVPFAAVTAFPDDLAGLHGTPEFPILVLPKPIRAHQVEEALRLALPPIPASQPGPNETSSPSISA